MPCLLFHKSFSDYRLRQILQLGLQRGWSAAPQIRKIFLQSDLAKKHRKPWFCRWETQF